MQKITQPSFLSDSSKIPQRESTAWSIEESKDCKYKFSKIQNYADLNLISLMPFHLCHCSILFSKQYFKFSVWKAYWFWTKVFIQVANVISLIHFKNVNSLMFLVIYSSPKEVWKDCLKVSLWITWTSQFIVAYRSAWEYCLQQRVVVNRTLCEAALWQHGVCSAEAGAGEDNQEENPDERKVHEKV